MPSTEQIRRTVDGYVRSFRTEDKGLFRRAGLKIESKQNLTAGAAAEAVMGGQVDLAWNNLVGAMTAYGSGIPVRLVGITDYEVPGNMQVLVPKDSAIKDVADLRGRSVAVLSPGTTCTLAIKAALDARGLQPDSVRFEVVAPGDHPTVLSSAKVDSTCTADPIRGEMIAELGARPVFDTATSPIGGFAIGGFITSAPFAQANAGALKAFNTALGEAAMLANHDPALAREALANHGEIDRSMARTVTVTRYATDPRDQASAKSLADAMVRFGSVRKPIDVPGFFGTE